MITVEEEIEALIGRPFRDQHSEIEPCWLFCQQILELYNKKLSNKPETLSQSKKERPELLDVVMFNCMGEWHAGVVWPDGLHFIHAVNDPQQPDKKYRIITKSRLTAWPWNAFLTGYYK